MKKILLVSTGFILILVVNAYDYSNPIISEDVVFEEVDGLVAVEAEYFYKQCKTETRKWYRTSKDEIPAAEQDPDGSHADGVCNNVYIEVLPDTRTNHDDKLIHGENFSNEPGELAVVHYKVYFNTPGEYYVWVRAHSTGTSTMEFMWA